MALSKAKKHAIVDDVTELLSTSKMTVITNFRGTTVKDLQDLRRQAKADGTSLKVIKNRLVAQAIKQVDNLKDIDVSSLQGMLLYAFNADDEVAPAQVIANFAKTSPNLEFMGAISADGQFIEPDDVKALAALPTKEQLRGMLVGTLAAPLSGFVGVMTANVRSVLNVLQARSESLAD